MRVLLISPNKQKTPVVYPLGLATLAAYLRGIGHEVRFLDLLWAEDESTAVEKALRSFSPHAVGVSLRNVDSEVPRDIDELFARVHRIVRSCEEQSQATLFMGGPAFTLLAEEMLRKFQVPYGVVGDGEYAFAEALKRLEANQSPAEVRGIVSLDDGQFEDSAPWIVDEFGFPFASRTLPSARYGANVQTKRGCSKKCIYCTYPILEGHNVRVRSPESVGAELEYLYRGLGIDEFTFVDNLFDMPSEHAVAVCQEMIRRKLNMRWIGFFHPANFNRQIAELAKRAGCTRAEFGIDAASERMIRNLCKGFSKQELAQAARLCHEYEIEDMYYLLFGGPGETLETVHESMQTMERIEAERVFVLTAIRIFPGTPLEQIALREGVVQPGDSYLTPQKYRSSLLEPGWLETLLPYAEAHPEWSIPYIASREEADVLREYQKVWPVEPELQAAQGAE